VSQHTSDHPAPSRPASDQAAQERLVGRGDERQQIVELLDAATARGGGMVIRGEPGIGKSVLLAAAIELARERGFRVVSAVGVESEGNLPFAGLHRLVRPLLGGVVGLPKPQRDALLGAFGMAETATPDLFLVGLGVLGLLAETAVAAPLLLTVDDAHWLDDPTRQVLAFVARRLDGDPVVLLATARDGYASSVDDPALPELHLERLSDGDSTALLDAQAPNLGPALRDRILREAAGNPLALVELPVAVRASPPRAHGEDPEILPMTARLERAFASRVRRLPASAQTILHVAAVDDGDELGEVLRAAAIVSGAEPSMDELDPAVAAGLVRLDGAGLRFRHPLVRSAVYQQAGDPARRAAHQALAAMLTDQPDRRAWHRASAALGHDEDVAVEVEAAAERARRRGGILAAIAAQERAAQLTADPQRRAGRLLHAAEMAFERGDRELLERLLAQAHRLGLSPLDSSRAVCIRELFNDGNPGEPVAIRRLVDRAETATAEGHTDLALNFLFAASLRCWWRDPGYAVRHLVAGAADQLGLPDADPRALAVVAGAAPVERAGDVTARLAALELDYGNDPDALRLFGMAAQAVGDFDRAAVLLSAAADGLRAQGRLALVAQAQAIRAHTALELGDWETAITCAEEGRQLAEETAQPLWLCVAWTAAGHVAALRGDTERAHALAADAERIVLPRRLSDLLTAVQAVRGAADLGAGRHAQAYTQLRRVFDAGDVAHHPRELYRAVVDFADAAVLTGSRDDARTLLQPVEAAVMLSPSPKLHVVVACARAILADDDDAEPLYTTALQRIGDRWPYERARLGLAYGAWLRRHRRAADSRAPLRAAADTFETWDLTPWADRASRELRASGETRARRDPGSWLRLSPQELQIARMAADGLSNGEIGQRLYLSHKTVASHLYRIFPKLGITSRAQLRGALGVVGR